MKYKLNVIPIIINSKRDCSGPQTDENETQSDPAVNCGAANAVICPLLLQPTDETENASKSALVTTGKDNNNDATIEKFEMIPYTAPQNVTM